MKKILILLLTAIMLFSVSACGSAENGDTAATEASKLAGYAVPGTSVKHKKYEIKFSKAEVHSKIVSKDYFTEMPDEGNEFVVCFFAVRNRTKRDLYVNPLYLETYVDGAFVTESIILCNIDGCRSLGGALAAGDTTKGYVVYEVPKNWKQLKITYCEGYSEKDEKYNFLLTSDKLFETMRQIDSPPSI